MLTESTMLKRLLILNLLLQCFDGVASYRYPAEANQIVEAGIASWGVVGGLLYYKAFACVLLLLIFSLRHCKQLLAFQALTVTAAVYACFAVICVWKIFVHFFA